MFSAHINTLKTIITRLEKAEELARTGVDPSQWPHDAMVSAEEWFGLNEVAAAIKDFFGAKSPEYKQWCEAYGNGTPDKILDASGNSVMSHLAFARRLLSLLDIYEVKAANPAIKIFATISAFLRFLPGHEQNKMFYAAMALFILVMAVLYVIPAVM
jgi:hypothetical protein